MIFKVTRDETQHLVKSGEMLQYDGVKQFINLTDTPSSLTAGKWLKVNAAGDALEEVSAPAGGGDMLASTYDPTSVAGDAFLMANMAESATKKILTATERTKLSGIASGAEVNVQSDWNAASGDALILNKPSIPSALSDLTGDLGDISDGLTYVKSHNDLTDTLKTKLDGIEDGADVTDATNVDNAGAVMEGDFGANSIIAANTIDTPASLTIAEARIVGRLTGGNIKGLTASEIRTLINVEDGATADQTDAEIKTAYENNLNTNAYTDSEQTKLGNIESNADVTDATNVNSAGAVMESDYNATSFLYATTVNTPQNKTPAEVLGILSGNASADFSLNTNKLTNVTDPVSNQDAATKKYVDDNAGGGGASIWTTWTNASRTDDSTISSTTNLEPGTAVRYKGSGGNYEYGIVLSRATNAHTILGHPVTTADDDEFEYDAQNVKQSIETIHFSGAFNDADDDTLLASDLNMKQGFKPALANEYYLVGVLAICDSADTSSDPDVNAVIQGGVNKLFGTDITVNATEANSGTNVDATNRYYALDYTSKLEISIDKVGAGDAYDMDLTLIFVKA